LSASFGLSPADRKRLGEALRTDEEPENHFANIVARLGGRMN
jgi:hypothetical protein